ncbi:MAG: 33 kDa chaperonin [Legionellaceae bacterium]
MTVEYDVLQRFLFNESSVRGVFVRLNQSYQTIINQHAYPQIAAEWLGEATVASVLLSAGIKYQGQLILQVQSSGTLKVLVAQCTNNNHIRGMVKWDTEASLPSNFTDAIDQGLLVITVQTDNGQRYQGYVELANKTLAVGLIDYFYQSEQIPTFLILAANDKTAAGFLLQKLPSALTDTLYDDFWEYVVKLAETLTKDELLNLSNQTILYRLFHEIDITLFDGESVSFGCSCSIARSEKILQTMSYDEAQAILKESLLENPVIKVTCEFCNRSYEFDPVDVARIFSENSHLSSTTRTT